MHLSSAQKVILGLYLGSVVASCVYVPWVSRLQAEGWQSVTITRGYRFLWSPPQLKKQDPAKPIFAHNNVDLTRVGLQLLGLTALCGIALLVASPKSSASNLKSKEGSHGQGIF